MYRQLINPKNYNIQQSFYGSILSRLSGVFLIRLYALHDHSQTSQNSLSR